MRVAMPRAKATIGTSHSGRVLLAWSVVLSMLCIVLHAAGRLADSQRASQEVARSRMEATVMLCHEGRIIRGEPTVLDRITGNAFKTGQFLCTDWRMRDPS